jgi:hypothetical protein
MFAYYADVGLKVAPVVATYSRSESLGHGRPAVGDSVRVPSQPWPTAHRPGNVISRAPVAAECSGLLSLRAGSGSVAVLAKAADIMMLRRPRPGPTRTQDPSLGEGEPELQVEATSS